MANSPPSSVEADLGTRLCKSRLGPDGRLTFAAGLALARVLEAMGQRDDLVLDVDTALERLARENATSAEVARHGLFAGLSIDETAEAPGLSRATAFREWADACSWLATALDSDR
jgi:hypothetical protein